MLPQSDSDMVAIDRTSQVGRPGRARERKGQAAEGKRKWAGEEKWKRRKENKKKEIWPMT